ncbi:PilZ domain-containing protein [Fluviispira multicolorata]|uniref:PilZ domain-containing protein n=1 Tax=Fluviispira multicolorata TaxID=2654512 RepID=A0A833JFJ3_9BACT|nr:PilZ domain-containing protein [Fluviispira multicolorata]KAB8033769.1 hypothetical protein GCL57_03415 [Fluviispira multicolorata]
MAEDTPKRKEPRYGTAIVVDVQMTKWNPLKKVKAILLDLSWHGFKIEFVKKVQLKNGNPLHLKIPIEQFQIDSAKFLNLKVIVKWFDEELQRTGGVYIHPKGENGMTLEKLIQKLAKLKQTEDELNQGSETNLSHDKEKAS